MKLALVLEGDDYSIRDDAAHREGKGKRLASLNLNQADVTIEQSGNAIPDLPIGNYNTLNDALIALREAGFEFERYE